MTYKTVFVLVVLVCLALITTSASAECAWLLWLTEAVYLTMDGSGPPQRTPFCVIIRLVRVAGRMGNG